MKFWWTQIRELREALRLQNEQFNEERRRWCASEEIKNGAFKSMGERAIESERKVSALRQQKERFESEVVELESALAEHSHAQRLLDRMEGVPREDRERVKQEVNEAFSALGEQSPLWLALQKLLAIQIHVEHTAARAHGLTNDERNLRLGRECSLEDFRASLLQIFARTRKK